MTLEQSFCATTLIQRNAEVFFNTSFFLSFYRLASCMHVIDCFHWPGTSLRFTSACNYWPSSLVSQCCWCVYVCVHVCTCTCHTLTINRLHHLFWVASDAAWGENNHRIMDPCYLHTSYITQCGSNSAVSGLSLVVKCEVINLQYGRSCRRSMKKTTCYGCKCNYHTIHSNAKKRAATVI